MIDDKTIEQFFAGLNDADKNMLTIEEFKNEVNKRQLNFSENE
jgi:hypothetical protein